MEIEVENLSKIRRMIGDRIGSSDPDTIMVRRYGEVDENSIQFLKGPEDFQEFMATEPDAHSYEAVSTDALYKLLCSLDDETVDARFVVERGRTIYGLIDLGSMLEDRGIVENIEFAIAKLSGIHFDQHDRLGEDGRRLQEQIIRDLFKLCKDENGVATASALWDEFSNVFDAERPAFVASRMAEWFGDNQLKQVTPSGTVLMVRAKGGLDNESLAAGGFWRQMVALGSLLDFSDVSVLAGRTDGAVDERQYFGRPGKLDRIDINWQLENGTLLSYDITLRKHIEIPERTMAGVDLVELEGRLRRFDWSREHMNFNEEFPLLAGISNDIRRLYQRSDESHELGRLIAFKYWAYTPNEDIIPGIAALKAEYEKKVTLKPGEDKVTVLQAYNLLDGRSLGQTGQDGVWRWKTLAPAQRTPDGGRVLVNVAGSEGFDPLAALLDLGGRRIGLEELESVRNGSRMIIDMESNGTAANRIVYADPYRRAIVIDKAEGQHYGLYRVSDEELFHERKSKQREQLREINRRADCLGIYTEKLRYIEGEMLIRNSSFTVVQDASFGEDMIKYTINIGYDGRGGFDIGQVQADLRRDFAESRPVVGGRSIIQLRKDMETVDWTRDFASTGSMVFNIDHPSGDREMQMKVMDIRVGLESLFFSREPEGPEIAAALGLRFLKDTPNEELVPALLRIMEQRLIKVSFPKSPELSLDAMYNLMNGRFALGRTVGVDGTATRSNWYRLNKGAAETGEFPLSVVSSGYGVLSSLSGYDLVEARVPGLALKAAAVLERGGLFPVTLNRKDFTTPLVVFANPGTESLTVHFGETLRLAGLPWEGHQHAATKIELDQFSKIIERSHDLEGAIRKVDAATGRGQSAAGEGQEEHRRSLGL